MPFNPGIGRKVLGNLLWPFLLAVCLCFLILSGNTIPVKAFWSYLLFFMAVLPTVLPMPSICEKNTLKTLRNVLFFTLVIILNDVHLRMWWYSLVCNCNQTCDIISMTIHISNVPIPIKNHIDSTQYLWVSSMFSWPLYLQPTTLS